eukprot:gene5868-7300_t
METENKRKGHVATESTSKKATKVSEKDDASLKSKTVLEPQSIPISNDGNALLLKLAHTKAMSIKTRDEIIFSAQRDDNLALVFKGLSERRFLSVPVFTQTDRKRWFGFIDLSDIVRYVCSHFEKEKMSTQQDFWKLSQESESFKKLRVDDVMTYPHTRENKFHPITQDYSLYTVFEIFARNPHIHRIPILDDMNNRHLVSILTQSQLIKFVYENIDLLGSKKDLLVKNMVGINTNVLTVPSSTIAIDAFKLIEEKNVSGIGIVNGQGHLIDTLSVRDLKGMATDGSLFWKLYKPVSEFLDFIKNDPVTLRPRNTQFVLNTDTFESVLSKIYTNQIHRIFIIDSMDSKKPIGVISLGDLLLQLFPCK